MYSCQVVIGPTDVNKRLPRFREAMASIADIENRGGFESVSPRILEYLKACEPVGLGDYRQIQLPDDHDPQTAPAVLMLQPEEYDYRLLHRESELERQAADAIILQAGERTPVLPGMLSMGSSLPAAFGAAVLTTPVAVMPERRNRAPFAIRVPRVIVVKAEDMVPTALLGLIMAHEADHWDFFNTAGTLYHPSRELPLTPLQYEATAEKRAYGQTSRQVEVNLGYYADVRPDDLAAAHEGIAAAEAHRLMQPDERTAHMFPDGQIPLSLAVAAASLLFGRLGDSVASRQEINAFLMMGVIRSPYASRGISDIEPDNASQAA